MLYLKLKTNKGTISYLILYTKNAIGNLIIGSTKHEQNMFLKDEKLEEDHFWHYRLWLCYFFYELRFFVQCSYVIYQRY